MLKTGIVFLYLLVLSVWDIKERRVSVRLLALGGVLTVVFLGYDLTTGRLSWLFPLLGALPGCVLLAAAWLTKKMGYADGMVLLMLGAMGGYREGIFILGNSLLLISAASVMLLLLRRVRRETRLPYIPFLAAGFVLLRLMG